MLDHTYWIKKTMPKLMLRAARAMKVRIWRLKQGNAREMTARLEYEFPWSSPNVWQRVVDFYVERSVGVIFEYGTGVSSLHHIRNLALQGGRYIGVEHQPEWYVEVLSAVVRQAVSYCWAVDVSGEPVSIPDKFPVAAYDTVLHLSGNDIPGCTVTLKLRPPHNRTDDADGTLEEFQDYVYALTEPSDVVIVDGRARKACINYALDNNMVNPGGVLVLFEAGRGVEGWLDWPALQGTSNYQPEVQRMLELGGELVDGCGLDRWPGPKRRRSATSTALHYAMEACFLCIPTEGRRQKRSSL
jgi:hypothetical protein